MHKMFVNERGDSLMLDHLLLFLYMAAMVGVIICDCVARQKIGGGWGQGSGLGLGSGPRSATLCLPENGRRMRPGLRIGLRLRSTSSVHLNINFSGLPEDRRRVWPGLRIRLGLRSNLRCFVDLGLIDTPEDRRWVWPRFRIGIRFGSTASRVVHDHRFNDDHVVDDIEGDSIVVDLGVEFVVDDCRSRHDFHA